MQLKTGARLRSQVDATELVVVRPLPGEVELTVGRVLSEEEARTSSAAPTERHTENWSLPPPGVLSVCLWIVPLRSRVTITAR